MSTKMWSCLQSACFLCYILVPMAGTVFYERGNVWQQYPPTEDLFSLSSGNVLQEHQSWDPPRPIHSRRVRQQEPSLDSSASFYSEGVWQQISYLDSPSPVQSDVTDLEKCIHHIVCTYCKNAVGKCNPNMYKPCFSLNFPFSAYSPSGKGRYNPVDRSGFHTSPDTTEADVCTYCESIAATLRLRLTMCSSYCTGTF